MEELLRVQNLKTYFFDKKNTVGAVDGVDFRINQGETVALVGESGCGKSMTALSIMRLVPGPNGKIVGGAVALNGINLSALAEEDMCQIRGNEIAMIFQEPMTSLNPVLTIGEQIIEVLTYHKQISRKQAIKEAIELLKVVGIARAEELISDYPHRLSGGMRQRVMIAMAISCNPKLLIADEPTTALDVTIQAQILDLMKNLSKQINTSILLITHDLGVVSELAERVIVMYAGQIVEQANVDELFDEPKHPYTQGLIDSVPNIEGDISRLIPIKGNVPTPERMPKGCRFAPRCSHAFDRCLEEEPPLMDQGSGQRTVRCFLYDPKKEAENARNKKYNHY